MPKANFRALLIASVVLAAAVALPAATQAHEGAIEVDDAVFAWSLNDQTNARSHNPAAINFLSAAIADPGSGGATLPSTRWQAEAGNVAIQKLDAAGTWQPATWAGLGTDATGAAIGIYGPFSGHRVRIGAGTGTFDATADTAHLSWVGTFTVVYYSGNSVFTVTDPVLEVVGGTGSVSATLGGWAADRTDPTAWYPVAPQRVVIAALAGVDVTETAMIAIPAYDGVVVEGSVPQARTGQRWGSFPAPMVAFLTPLGVDQFWYSTGLQADSTKFPAPITVGYGAAEPPSAQPTGKPTPTPTPTPTNTATHRPTPQHQPKPSPTASPTPGQSPMAMPAPVVPPAVGPPTRVIRELAAPDLVQVAAATGPSVAADSSAAGGPASGAHPGWWLGAVLLLAAAGLLLSPRRRRGK